MTADEIAEIIRSYVDVGIDPHCVQNYVVEGIEDAARALASPPSPAGEEAAKPIAFERAADILAEQLAFFRDELNPIPTENEKLTAGRLVGSLWANNLLNTAGENWVLVETDPSPVGEDAEIEAGRLRCEIRKALGLPSMESYSSGGSMVLISAEQSAKMRADADEHKISASPVGGEMWRTIGDTLEWLRNYLENLDDYPEPREAIERVEAAISALKRRSGEG